MQKLIDVALKFGTEQLTKVNTSLLLCWNGWGADIGVPLMNGEIPKFSSFNTWDEKMIGGGIEKMLRTRNEDFYELILHIYMCANKKNLKITKSQSSEIIYSLLFHDNNKNKYIENLIIFFKNTDMDFYNFLRKNYEINTRIEKMELEKEINIIYRNKNDKKSKII